MKFVKVVSVKGRSRAVQREGEFGREKVDRPSRWPNKE